MTRFRSLFILLFSALCLGAKSPDWRVVDVAYESEEWVVAAFSVLDFGAKGDGKSDDTKAFQTALDTMEQAGGGIVFVPEGHYAIRGRLVIPRAVTLRGEWKEPSLKEPGVKGTVLKLFAGKGKEGSSSIIKLGLSAGIRDMSLWFPEQSSEKPVPYPFVLEQGAFNNATFKNLTLVNAYNGIKIGPQGNELHYVNNVYGCPLKVGIRYDSTTDIGRLEKISFSPVYWEKSGLPGAPKGDSLKKWLWEHGNAIHMLRSDWEYVDRVHIQGYRVGFKVTQGQRGAANAQFRRLMIERCRIALWVEKTNPYGMVFTDCYFDARDYGVILSPRFDSVVLFSDCKFRGRTALKSRGNGVVLIEQSLVKAGNIEMDSGVISMAGTELRNESTKVIIAEDVTGAVFAGNQLKGGADVIQNGAGPGVVQISEEPVSLVKIPKDPIATKRDFKPPSKALKVILPDGKKDMRAKIQDALDTLAETGGTVLLPGEDYVIRGSLNVPSGVEMRGVHDVPHHTSAAGSVLHFYPADESPSITLEASSGLRGLSMYYPDQSIEDVQEYPFLIQGRGSDVYIINVNCANPYKYLDLASYQCDRHYVDYLSGSPLKVGVYIGGGSKNGQIRNLQFNPHYWSRAPDNKDFYAKKTQGGIRRGTGRLLWAYQKENMDAIIVSDSENQFLYQNFVYGSLYGIRFTKDDGEGPKNLLSHGHGTDGSKIGVYFDHGSEQITMVNSELVAMSSNDKVAIRLGPEFDAKVVLINSMVWGQPDYLAVVENGSLHMQNLHATRFGGGIKVVKGEVVGNNINFLDPVGSHLELKGTGTSKLTGVVSSGAFISEGVADEDSLGLVVERPKSEIQY